MVVFLLEKRKLYWEAFNKIKTGYILRKVEAPNPVLSSKKMWLCNECGQPLKTKNIPTIPWPFRLTMCCERPMEIGYLVNQRLTGEDACELNMSVKEWAEECCNATRDYFKETWILRLCRK